MSFTNLHAALSSDPAISLAEEHSFQFSFGKSKAKLVH
jgi:hypothetical protein